MKLLTRIKALFESKPESGEDYASAQEAERLRDEMATIRVSQGSSAGENYQSGRGSRH